MIFLMCISLIRLLVSNDFRDSSFVSLTIFAFIGFIIYILSSRKTLVLAGPNVRVITFKPNWPSKTKVDGFIKTLIDKRNQVLTMKFGNISRKLPYETQHERILWLNSIGVFTNQEVEEKKKVLNMLFASDGGKYDISLN